MKRRSSTVSRSRSRFGGTRLSARRSSKPVAPRSKASSRSARKAASGRTRKSAKPTTDHEEIRRWVEARGGQPATVKRTAKGPRQSSIIRIDFPGFSGSASLKRINWDEWFEIFEDRQLAFLRQDKTASGKPSRFNKLVSRGR